MSALFEQIILEEEIRNILRASFNDVKCGFTYERARIPNTDNDLVSLSLYRSFDVLGEDFFVNYINKQFRVVTGKEFDIKNSIINFLKDTRDRLENNLSDDTLYDLVIAMNDHMITITLPANNAREALNKLMVGKNDADWPIVSLKVRKEE